VHKEDVAKIRKLGRVTANPSLELFSVAVAGLLDETHQGPMPVFFREICPK
jgi:hypothetical protein